MSPSDEPTVVSRGIPSSMPSLTGSGTHSPESKTLSATSNALIPSERVSAPSASTRILSMIAPNSPASSMEFNSESRAPSRSRSFLLGSEFTQVLLPGGDTVTVSVLEDSLSPNVTLQVEEGDPDAVAQGGIIIASSVVSIVLITSRGQFIQPNAPISICFGFPENSPNQTPKGKCLGSFDESQRKWACDDLCLKVINGSLCGTVDHLTNFALLLMGDLNNRNGDPCASQSNPGYVLSYISAAFVGTAICIVLFSVLLIEIRFRYVHYRIETELRITMLTRSTQEV